MDSFLKSAGLAFIVIGVLFFLYTMLDAIYDTLKQNKKYTQTFQGFLWDSMVFVAVVVIIACGVKYLLFWEAQKIDIRLTPNAAVSIDQKYRNYGDSLQFHNNVIYDTNGLLMQ